MNVGNPSPPPPTIGGDLAVTNDFAVVLATLARSKSHLTWLAVLSVFVALVSVVSVASSIGLAAMGFSLVTVVGLPVLGHLIVATMLLRMAGCLGASQTDPSEWLARFFRSSTQMWVVGLISSALATLSGFAVSAANALGLAAVLASEGLRNPGVVDAARALRKTLRIILIGGAVLLLLSVGSTFLAFARMGGGLAGMPLQLKLMMMTHAAAQVGFGWLVWQQVPALDGFIARPDVASLGVFADASARLWRWTLLGALLLAAFNMAPFVRRMIGV